MEKDKLIENGCTCDRCENKYKIDLNLPDELWDKINTSQFELLCPECIGELLTNLNEFGAYHLTSLTATEREVKDEEIEQAGQQLQISIEGEIRTFIWVFKEGARWMEDKLYGK